MKDESQPAGNRGKVGSVRTLPTRRGDYIGDCEGKDVTNGTEGCDVFFGLAGQPPGVASIGHAAFASTLPPEAGHKLLWSHTFSLFNSIDSLPRATVAPGGPSP
jgi:hypothetical protein